MADHIVYDMQDGKMVQVAEPNRSHAYRNFVIVCAYGDWSGFRTLSECEAQFAELEYYERMKPGRGYMVVER